MSIFRPISISLSPNTEQDDVWLAFRLLFQPWKWRRGLPAGEAESVLEREFAKYMGVKYAFALNSGRSSFLAILKSLDLEKGDEVLLQAFTCNAVPNPVIWAELKPIYVDCNEDDFNIDVEDLERKITPKSKVVIVQHTFGLPADMQRVMEICEKHNLILIEDCAHALGAKYKGKLVGTFGKAAFFSFSRDKVISSVYGGMAVTNDDILGEKIKAYQKNVGYPAMFWILQQLMHPIALNWNILPTYRIFGKYLLVIAQRLYLLSKAVHWKEKRGRKPGYFPKRMPNALAILACRQFEKLERFNAHRRKIAQLYATGLQQSLYDLPGDLENRESIFLRYAIKHPRAHDIIRKFWRNNILIGDWYTNPVAPDDTRLDKLQYDEGSCPKAESLANVTLNLPTHIHISTREVKKIIELLHRYASE